MKILSFSMKTLLLLAIPALFFASCKDDEVQPDTATIHGTITIDNNDVWATWQDSGEVQLTIFPEFVEAAPPTGAGWGAISANVLYPGFPGGTFALGAPSNAQNPIILNYTPGVNTYHYELEVDPGTYSALALGFRHDLVTDPSLRTATLGVHWNNPDSTSHGIVIKVDVGGGNIVTFYNYPAPVTFTLNKGDNVEYNFKADFSFVEAWYQ